MKRCILLFTWMFFTTLSAQEHLTGPQIIDKINAQMNQPTMQARMEMTITTTSGQLRTFEYMSYSKDHGEKNLLVYKQPRRVKGQKLLMLNNADDIWAYFARTKRVRKLATHAKRQSFEGSDFSYEDMGAGNAFVTDFQAKRMKDEQRRDVDCYTVELHKKADSNSAYSKIIMWIAKSNFVPIEIHYYDKDEPNRVKKILIQDHIQTIDGVPTGTKLVMTNKSDNSKTVMVLKDVKYNIALEDDLFTERGLRK